MNINVVRKCVFVKQLYVQGYKQSAKIPLNFMLSGSIPHDSYMRAMAIYTTPVKIREVVRTCPKHKADIKALCKYKAEEVGHM